MTQDDAAFFAALRQREFPQLAAERLSYLDYTGAALPSLTQVREHSDLLAKGIFGNPHSEHLPSRRSSEVLARARERVLRFVNADPAEYAVVFTANASAAAKLVAESFPFRPGSDLVLSGDNHNSINGLREYARRAGARLRVLELDAELRLRDPLHVLAETRGRGPHLLAFPAQSNFSGVQHPSGLIAAAQERGLRVLLDAAAYAPTSTLDVSTVAADFVTLSFYKIFGFPTGLGALVARRESLALLQRPWFAGGTVDWASVQNASHQLRSGEEAFEDGTPNYLGVAALPSGFDLLEEIGMDRLHRHVRSLTRFLLAELCCRIHASGTRMFEIHGPRNLNARGATVSCNVLTESGNVLPYEMVEAELATRNIAVRGGCFCNPGAAEAAFGLPAGPTAACLRRIGTASFAPRRLRDCLGGRTAVGALRISMGVANSREDIAAAVAALADVATRGSGRGRREARSA